MKIRGESGGVPARMGGGAGGVSRGGKVLNRVKANVKDKLEDSKVANKIANTKPVVKASEAVAKKVQTSRSKRLKKSVNIIADSADKARAAQIAKNSVKVIAGGRDKGAAAAEFNRGAAIVKKNIASGKFARDSEALVKQMKPAKVVKVNSAPAKSADTAKKAADAKALKAANKKKK
jgi:hypothetical protein